MEPFRADPERQRIPIIKRWPSILVFQHLSPTRANSLVRLTRPVSRVTLIRPTLMKSWTELSLAAQNFMNAIPGTKEGTNEQFYMTNATSIKPLQKAYEAYLKNKGVEKIEWIGDTGGGEFDRTMSESSLQASGGLDCRENHYAPSS